MLYTETHHISHYAFVNPVVIVVTQKRVSMIYPYEKIIPFEFGDDKATNSILTENFKTLGPLHSALCKGMEFTGKNQFPIVEPYTSQLPEELCSVHRLKNKPDSLLRDICGHFFTSDSHIEPFWNYPFRYIQWLRKLLKRILFAKRCNKYRY